MLFSNAASSRMGFSECAREKLVAFSCKRRGFCLSCGAWRKPPPTSSITSSPLSRCANAHGFSLHAAVRWRADQRLELDERAVEQLCRYITRPAIANERLKRNRAGQVVLQLKSPYKDGTTHIVMEPLEFMERLAARVYI